MKTIKICLILLACNLVAVAQEKINSKFKYKVTYDLSFSLDSTDTNTKKSEDMVLFLGDNISSYSSRSKLIGNSVVVKGNTAHTSKESLTAFPYVIIKDIKNDYLAYTLQIVDDYFFYDQKASLFNWKLHNDKKVIQGYNVQKATTTYSGRDYVAWFTEEIPISDGPFKFNGLPGLILEINDTKNHYNFTLKSFEKLKPSVSFKINFKQYIKTDKKTLFETWYRYRKDPFTYANNPNVTMSPEVHQKYIKSFTELLEKENNRIEKN